ncbi:MAG: UDP-N-acetylmuramoyl-L-alanine--D-glutamate ligase [Coriobacteriales bacterium]|nr:UDP-N-acetylmuramoyl-L-alanine--D-glutamate ligase [Coriobacteriales bacterium]
MDFPAFLATLPARPRFGRVCILGMGVSGTACARFLLEALSSGEDLLDGFVIYAGADTGSNREAARPFIDAGVEVRFGEEVEGPFDLCVASPGISQLSGFYRSAAAVCGDIVSEPEFAYRVSPEHWVGITGTNGKTTTTVLATHLLEGCGIAARAVGNIGDPCITAVREREPGTYLVAELSSFQLASSRYLSPEAAILLNITPDHLAWHGTHEAYAEAKMKLFGNLSPDALAIVDMADEGAAAHAGSLAVRGGIRMLGITAPDSLEEEGSAAVRDGRLRVWLPGKEPVDLGPASDLAIKGAHNMVNALAAGAAALQCGADPAGIEAALATFQPLEHRIEPCGVKDGVRYFNDSKATNTDAVGKALTAFPDDPLIVLLGGHDKGTDLTELVRACSGACKAVVCFGEAQGRFAGAFEGSGVQVLRAPHLKEALLAARDIAVPGDVVLLSPACSSFDEFSGFEERGSVFKGYVNGL